LSKTVPRFVDTPPEETLGEIVQDLPRPATTLLQQAVATLANSWLEAQVCRRIPFVDMPESIVPQNRA
jgi:hypothetical protein